MNGTERLLAWITEREAIRVRRETGKFLLDHTTGKAVLTLDPILAEYRFCNVRREDDRVTKWIAKNWRDPYTADPDNWFAMVVARFINWPFTLQYIEYPCPWDPKRFLERMAERKKAGVKLYTGAYMVRADRDHANKFEYQEKVVFTPMWEARERLRPKEGDTLNSYHMLLGQFHGLGSFMAAQIVADLKYTHLREASDWMTFAASGPGSRRGLNRVLGFPPDNPWTEERWRSDLARLHEKIVPEIHHDQRGLHAQDLQNCLCEFDKYERTRLGEGRPRSKFIPTKEALP